MCTYALQQGCDNLRVIGSFEVSLEGLRGMKKVLLLGDIKYISNGKADAT